ncbi:MAG: flagellar motor protein MotB [Oscillospiraceae bacterium]|nr:flagellar motor protein MotB [Oscillospiraceae bacterium]
MAKKKERSKIDPNAWMNTYSDMVTLLMCFFVLLYASSTPDETKWQYIFQNFTSSGQYINPFVTTEDPNRTEVDSDDEGNSIEPPGDPTDSNDHEISNTDLPSNFNDLASWFSAMAASSVYKDDISVSVNSSGSITIRFSDSVLFAPDSAELLSSGREAISMFLPGIRGISDYIGRIEVSGHTALGFSPEVNDWDLSAARACSVIKYMDFQRVVESKVYLAEGYAQYSPIASNDTPEGKAKNRRVEITIIRNDNNTISNDVIEDILKYDYGIGHGYGPGSSPSNADAVQQIIDRLEEKYETTIDKDGNVLGSESGPTIPPSVDGIPDDVIHEVDEEGNIITDASEAPPEPSEGTE